MLGVLLALFGSVAVECSTLIGKMKMSRHEETPVMMGFLNALFFVAALAVIALVKPEMFVFSIASLPTFLPRTLLGVLQAHVTVRALFRASRSTFGFIRTLTIPLLLGADVFLGYVLTPSRILGILLIIGTLFVVFLNHGFERKGAWLVLFTAVNAAVLTSLYQYDIRHFNSVVAEQLVSNIAILGFFFVLAVLRDRSHPLRLLRQPVFVAQSGGNVVGAALDSFAILFAPASVIFAATRSSAIFFAMLSGNLVFHERHFFRKVGVFVFLAIGIGLLVLG